MEQVVVQEKDNAGNLVKETRLKEGKHLVMAGTLDALILSLFDESTQDVTFVDTFLLTYRMYLSAPMLLKKISTLFEAGSIKKASAGRVTQVVKKWLQRYWIVDFQLENLQNSVNELWIVLAPHVITSSQENLSLVARMTGSVAENKVEEAVTAPSFFFFLLLSFYFYFRDPMFSPGGFLLNRKLGLRWKSFPRP